MKQRKHIYVLATGGTIAGQAESGAATTGYRAGAVSVDALLSAVPELSEIAEVSGEQVAAIDSKDMTEQIQWELVRRCRELLTAGGDRAERGRTAESFGRSPRGCQRCGRRHGRAGGHEQSD